MNLTYKLKNIIIPKIKFAITSSIATIIDHLIYILLINWFIESIANLISYSIGMVINFMLQKKFIFILRRKLHITFIISIFFSLLGLLITTLLIHLFSKNTFFSQHKYINKLLVTGIVFIYNFYTKRFAFEKEYSKL